MRLKFDAHAVMHKHLVGGGVMQIEGNEFEIGDLTKPACNFEKEVFQAAVTGDIRHTQ
jgi:hypothetical protein